MAEAKKESFFKSDRFRMFIGKYGIGVVLVIMMVFISIAQPSFLTPRNLISVATQISINGLLCYGLTIAILTMGIDLSVGAQLALTSVIIAKLIQNGVPGILAIIVGVGVATGFGLLMGILIAKFNMFAFVVTLAMQLVIRGLAQVVSGGKAIAITDNFYKSIYITKVLGIPVPIIIFILVTLAMYFMLHWTKLGRYMFAVGGNVNAAIASGISKDNTLISVYVISGFLAGLAAVIYSSKVQSGQSNFGVAYETDAIAASVLGGTSFAGGIATIPGCVLGIFIIGFIYNGMNMIGVSSYLQTIVKGAVIIGAVMLDMVMSRKK